MTVEAGRNVDDMQLSVRLYLDPASNMRPALSIAGDTQQMIDSMSQWKSIGVDHVLVDITAPGGPGARLEAMQAFMTDVVPNIG